MKRSSVTLEQMLDAREARALAQRELLAQAEASDCLVSLSLNIAGDVKRTPRTRMLFDHGMKLFDGLGFEQRARRVKDAVTGTEALVLLRADAAAVKEALEGLEAAFPAARLYDFDVLDARGDKLSRREERRCLVCGGPVTVCARSRAHGLDAVRAATDRLLDDFCAERLACAAHGALLAELHTTPKPGLVDDRNNGAHRDMDVALFTRSADAIRDYFRAAALLGMADAGMPALKEEGLAAEAAMFAATGGVNTHKGLIYLMGLLLYGMGRALYDGGSAVEHASALARTDADARLARAKSARDTNGAAVYASYGASGAVGEAADGFPHAVFCAGRLDAYRGEESPGALALCDVMAVLSDTNLLHRGGEAGLAYAQAEARRIAALPVRERIDELTSIDDAMIARNLSPGGCADMLALAYLLDDWRALSAHLFGSEEGRS